MENNSSPNHNDFKPKYFNLLSEEDQEKYNRLRSTLSSHICRNRRGKRLETFAEMLNAIKAFCIHGDSDDWKRCLVCGVCWLSNGIAINTRQLGLLIDKCKSSINGSLQKMGYSTLQSRSESAGPLVEAIPELKNNFAELREWTVRLFLARTPQPNLPNYNVSTSFPFASPAPQRAQCCGYPSNPQEFPIYINGQNIKNMSQPNLSNYAYIAPSNSMTVPHPQPMQQQNLPPIPPMQPISHYNQMPQVPQMNQPMMQMPQATLNPQMPQSVFNSQIPQTALNLHIPQMNQAQQMANNGNYQHGQSINPDYSMYNNNVNHVVNSTPNNAFQNYTNNANNSQNDNNGNNPTNNAANNSDNNSFNPDGLDLPPQDQSDFFDDPFALTPNFLLSDDQNDNNSQDPFDPNYTM